MRSAVVAALVLCATSVAPQVPRPAGVTRAMLADDTAAHASIARAADSVVKTRGDHVRTGARLGFFVGGALGFLYPWPSPTGCVAAQSPPTTSGFPPTDAGCPSKSTVPEKFLEGIALGMSVGVIGAGIGSLIGWFWPVQEHK